MRVDRNRFARLLSSISKAVESRNTIPILGHVKLVNKDNQLTATATDLDIEITGSIPAEGDDAAFCVDAKMLAGIVSKLSADTVDMEPTDNRVVVKAGRSRFTLDTLPVANFPEMSAGAFDTEFDIDLAALVTPVQFAMSDETTRYYLCGVYVHPNGDSVVAVATDGHRLSKYACDVRAEFPGVILPRKLVGLIPKGTVRFAVSGYKVRVIGDGVTIISKVIDGTFPDYQRVIPTGNGKLVTVDGATLLAATERVSVVSSERGRAVKLTTDDNRLVLSVEDKAVEDVDATVSEPIEIGFNAAYLVDVLRAVGAGEVRFAMEPGAPAVVTGSDDALTVVLMPMRV